MHAVFAHPFAAAAVAGFSWINLFWVLASIAAFLVVVAAFGRYLAATHPDPAPKPRPAAAPAPSASPLAVATGAPAGVAPEIVVAIAAAIHATLGDSAKVTSVVLAENEPESVEKLMLTWSLEGRREIYSSHRVR